MEALRMAGFDKFAAPIAGRIPVRMNAVNLAKPKACLVQVETPNML